MHFFFPYACEAVYSYAATLRTSSADFETSFKAKSTPSANLWRSKIPLGSLASVVHGCAIVPYCACMGTSVVVLRVGLDPRAKIAELRMRKPDTPMDLWA